MAWMGIILRIRILQTRLSESASGLGRKTNEYVLLLTPIGFDYHIERTI